MRRVVGLVVCLILVGWILTEVPVARTESTAGPSLSSWRRTVDGWEREGPWSEIPKLKPAQLHPAVVGAAELLASLIALIALSTSDRRSISDTVTRPPSSGWKRPRRKGQKGPTFLGHLPSIR